MSPRPSARFVVSMLICVQVLFGVNYVVTKSILNKIDPMVWASARACISAIVLLVTAALFGSKQPRLDRTFLKKIAVLALFGVVLNQAAFLAGLRLTTTSNSSVLNTMIPIFTLLMVVVSGQERFSLPILIGFVLSFGGVLVLRNVESIDLSDQTLVGDLLTIANCMSYAIFLTLSRDFMRQHDRLWVTAWLFVFGALGLAVMSLPAWATFQAPEWTPSLTLAAFFAVLGGTLVPYFLNNWALAHTESSRVALFAYLQPVVASGLAWMALGETVTPRTMLAGAIIFIGFSICLSIGSSAQRHRALVRHHQRHHH